MLWLILFLPHVVLDRVDVVELNHVICPTNGNEQGVYWIWWKWQTVNGYADYYVVDWRRQVEVPRRDSDRKYWDQVPSRDQRGIPSSDIAIPGDGAQEWYDTKTKTHRRVESFIFKETWTFYDLEERDAKRLPASQRAKLKGTPLDVGGHSE